MTVNITVSEQDVQDAQNFLVEYLTEQVPEANFAEGGAIRDLAIKAFSYIFAYLRGEIDRVKMRQSIYRLTTDGVELELDDLDQALDEILSNWFINRRGGQYAVIDAIMHFTRRSSVSISQSVKFWRNSRLAYTVNSTSDPYVISENTMLPRFDQRGNLVDYIVKIQLKSVRAGEEYNADPGKFVRVEVAGGGAIPYLSYVENTSKGVEGSAKEDNQELLDRSGTFITVRNLINNRSCDTVLREVVPAANQLLTVGMGEPEMIRDLRTELGSHIDLHLGGHYDTYAELPLVRTDEYCLIGGYFPRADGIINVFRDPLLTIDGLFPFTAAGANLQIGDVIYIQSGINGVPRGFPIIDITDHELLVSSNVPFPQASDEEGTVVRYSAGTYGPSYADKIPVRDSAASADPAYLHIPAGTSRHVQMPGKVMLSGSPVQDILLVEITDPAAGDTAYVNPSTATVQFPNRTNLTPVLGTSPSDMEYQVSCLNPDNGQSMFALTVINVGDTTTPPVKFDGQNLHVTYYTLNGFGTLHDYTQSRIVRVEAANHLMRARNPIWLSMTIPYRIKPTSPDVLNEATAAREIAKYINEFDPNDTLDSSDIATKLRNLYDSIIGAVFQFDIYFDLHTPDGQVASFKTEDIVSIFDTTSNGVTLLNGPQILVPTEMQAQGVTEITGSNLSTWYTILGISDRVVKYRAREDLIAFQLTE